MFLALQGRGDGLARRARALRTAAAGACKYRHTGHLPRRKGIAVAAQVFPVLSKGPVPQMLAQGHCRPSQQRKSSASFDRAGHSAVNLKFLSFRSESP